jgi:hypothetical protein
MSLAEIFLLMIIQHLLAQVMPIFNLLHGILEIGTAK